MWGMLESLDLKYFIVVGSLPTSVPPCPEMQRVPQPLPSWLGQRAFRRSRDPLTLPLPLLLDPLLHPASLTWHCWDACWPAPGTAPWLQLLQHTPHTSRLAQRLFLEETCSEEEPGDPITLTSELPAPELLHGSAASLPPLGLVSGETKLAKASVPLHTLQPSCRVICSFPALQYKFHFY